MTLDEIIMKQKIDCMYEGFCLYCTRQACLEYARSIIPEVKTETKYCESRCCSFIDETNESFNTCRTQILSRIEEDEK